MTKKISGAEYPLSKIFSSDFDYVVPFYQRPYAWRTEQASVLLDDLYDLYQRKTDEPYFFGSIVLIKEEDRPRAEVIDGQQRLITLTILLAAIASKLTAEARADYIGYIMKPGRPSQGVEPKPRLTLQVTGSFLRFVQSLDFETLLLLEGLPRDNEFEMNIFANSKLILERLNELFGDNEEELSWFGSFLAQRCFMNVVSTPDKNSAFRVFSVLNSPGMNLQPSNIIKAEVLGSIPAGRLGDFTERWEDLEVQTGQESFNELLGHVRMIFAKKKATRILPEEFRKHVLDKFRSPEQLFEEILEPYAEAFIIAKFQKYESTRHAEAVNRMLRWLNRIDNSDWMPPAMLFLASQKNKPEYTLWFFEKLERLAAYLQVCGLTVNERISRYTAVTRSLQGCHSREKSVVAVELTPAEQAQMLEALDGNLYEMTPNRRNYIILRLESFLSEGAAPYDSSLLTIEHVLPPNIAIESDWQRNWSNPFLRTRWIHRIANLVPLRQKRNSYARTFEFETKKSAYFAGEKSVSPFVLTKQVLNEKEWTLDVVKRRQKAILTVFADHWKLSERELLDNY